MRRILIGLAALAAAGPAAAHPHDDADRDIARAIPHPAEVEAAGEAVDRVVGALLDVPIGPLVDAIDAADPRGARHRRPHRRDETLGDLAADGDPTFEARLRHDIRAATAGAGAAAEQLAIVAPEMRRALERMEADVARAVDAARARRGRR
ncbi:MAG TPA: hypothetical protein VD887_13475 [Allosphingosinicella sp.]|nr:hypothetical protein [Allosphingosinicella sp.]HYG31210.1 hypothetical protein [Allosphingosinicella sp.]